MDWQFDGEAIGYTQNKTGVYVWAPLLPEMVAELEHAARSDAISARPCSRIGAARRLTYNALRLRIQQIDENNRVGRLRPPRAAEKRHHRTRRGRLRE